MRAASTRGRAYAKWEDWMWVIVGLLAVHYVADFLCQSDWMATRKSYDCRALTIHVWIYSNCFMAVVWIWQQQFTPAATFFVVTFVSHWITDALTSRWTSALWKRQMRHWFFCAVGFDQLLHTLALALTARWVGLA